MADGRDQGCLGTSHGTACSQIPWVVLCCAVLCLCLWCLVDKPWSGSAVLLVCWLTGLPWRRPLGLPVRGTELVDLLDSRCLTFDGSRLPSPLEKQKHP